MKKYRFILPVLVVLGFVVLTIGRAAVLQETPSPTQSETPTATPLPTETIFYSGTATPTLTTPTPDLSTMTVYRYTWDSPDGKWIIENMTAYPSEEDRSIYYLGMIARSADGSKEWRLVDEWVQAEGDNQSYAGMLLWSKDGQSLYYYLYLTRSLKDRCKYDPVKYNLGRMEYGYELRKVELESGDVTEVASCILSRPEYSPDKTILAYLGDGEIVLHEVDSDRKHTIPFDIGQKDGQRTWSIHWSPDSKAFAFEIHNGGYGTKYESVVLVADIVSMSVKRIVVEGEIYLRIIEWEGPGRLVVENGQGGWWVWDRESNTIARQVIPTPNLADMEVSRRTSTSPDGKWIAETTIAFPYEGSSIDRMYTGLTIRSANGKVEWKIVDEWGMVGIGWSFPEPIRWSKDGRSLYYTNRVVPDGCTVFPPHNGLYRVDLESGKATELFPRYQFDSFGISLSPDEKTLAYMKDRDERQWLPMLMVVLRDLDSGKERAVAVLENPRTFAPAKIVWSPDSGFLAVTVVEGPCNENWEDTSVLAVEAASLKVTPIVLADKRNLVANEWLENDRLLLSDPQRNIWSWNRENGELTFVGVSVETPCCAPTDTPTIAPTETPTGTPSETPTDTPTSTPD